jgi:serine/threonine protein phosphatase 1
MTSRRFVIPDIHGCSKTFRELIQKIGLNRTDELYLLGDYIDRGKDSAAVLDFILELQENAYQVFPIRGNHEEHLLDTYERYNPKMFRAYVSVINKSGTLLDKDGKLPEKYLNFLKPLPYFIELDNFWIVHGGFDTKRENVFTNFMAMIEIRKFQYDAEILKNKTVVRGHQVFPLEEIKTQIENRAKIISLDNGCAYTKSDRVHDHTKLGNLLCLNLDTFELIIQKNID